MSTAAGSAGRSQAFSLCSVAKRSLLRRAKFGVFEAASCELEVSAAPQSVAAEQRGWGNSPQAYGAQGSAALPQT